MLALEPKLSKIWNIASFIEVCLQFDASNIAHDVGKRKLVNWAGSVGID